jgi:outer membrane receptor protein involved in Fe transport
MNLLNLVSPGRFWPVIASRGRPWSALALLLAAVLAMPGVLQAQETTAAIRGLVVDASGAPVPNASVEVLDQRTGIMRSFTTSASGAFLATRLSPGGPYTVIVNETRSVVVESISVSSIYSLTIDMDSVRLAEEIEVVGQSLALVDVAPGPAGTFNTFEVETAPAFNRDIVEVYAIDPRINIDAGQRGFAVNCAGKHPRFNSVTLDGVSYNDRFGLNDNGYSTAVGMPFPFDGIAQVAVELAPFDVTYGGFSACNINSITKSGTNEFHGNAFYEYTGDNLRRNLSAEPPNFNDRFWGATVGGPIIKDKLFFFAAYENSSQFVDLAMGPAGSGNGVVRDWLSQADFDRVERIARDIYGYDTGGMPGDGAREADKFLLKLNWNINQRHNLAAIFNYFDGFEDRASDNDLDEFEFANHFYQKGSESKTYTLKLTSQWTNVFSTELFLSRNEMIDSQVTVGPKDFADFQINANGRQNVIYLGADDSRQANALNTKSNFIKLQGQYLAGNHVINGGYEREALTIFNQFVQHARGGEYDFFDSSPGNPDFCAGLTAQGRLDDPACSLSGIDRFELGKPSRIYYGSGGGTNDPVTASAEFTNAKNAFYLQDSIFIDKHNLTLVAGLRYEFFTSGDRPVFNPTFTDANGGLRNDANIDGISLWMPRLGFTWGVSDDLVLRGGVGRYSGGNPNVWISNAWSNDGLTNVQTSTNYGDSLSLFDGSIPLKGNEPGRETSIPTAQFDRVANTTPEDANDSFLVLIDPSYVQPSEWKFSAGGTYRLPGDVQFDFDYLHTELRNSAHYVDLSQEVESTTRAGAPVYAYQTGRNNFMLTNTDVNASGDVVSLSLRKFWLSGLDMFLGYAYVNAKDVVPMTSSVAFSNFENVALLDINNPVAGYTNYRVPHRFTLRASFGRRFFWDSETRFTLYGILQEGQPTTYVMESGGVLEGDSFIRSRHLLYVPTGPDDPNVVFGDGFDTQAFFAWVNSEGLSPGFVERNAQHANWTKRVDFRVDQEFPTGGNTRGVLYLKMYNVGNLLKGSTPAQDSDWGKVWDAPFFSRQIVDSSLNDEGQYVYERFTPREPSEEVPTRSTWEVRIGIGFRF